ncbi:MAG: sialidase family protein [Planctomycetota bacterium]
MLRKGRMLLGVVAALCCSCAWAQEDLIVNPSFEEGQVGTRPGGWSQHAYDGKDSTLTAPVAVAPGGHTGDKCAIVEVPEGIQWNLIEQTPAVPTDLSKGLLLSAWLRSDDPEGFVDVVVFVQASKRTAEPVTKVRMRFTDIGPEWKQYLAGVALEEAPDIRKDDALTVRAIIQAYAPRKKLCVDDVSLTVVGADKSRSAFLSAIPERYREGLVGGGVQEASLIVLKDGRVALSCGKGGCAVLAGSDDEGKTWGAPRPCRRASGEGIPGDEFSLVRLKSGKLGLVAHDRYRLSFSVSANEGRTWSEPIPINPDGPSCKPLNGAAFVTSQGRIVVPVWIAWQEQKRPKHPKRGYPPEETICWLSDDEGKTWRTGASVVVEHEGQEHPFCEGMGVELPDGRLMLFGRALGVRVFKCFSSDGGETWTKPEPTPLVSSFSPCALGRMPNGDLLCVWNQSSFEESKNGLKRHRLTCAVSSDDGETWGHYRNLESLDDVPKIEEKVHWDDIYDFDPDYVPFKQPTDREKYPHSPGPLRASYPALTFTKNATVIVYDYGSAEGVFPGNYLKARSLPYEWFYENP